MVKAPANHPTAHQKQVTFFPRVKAHRYAKEDAEEGLGNINLWYSEQEYKVFRDEIVSMRRAVKEGLPLEGYCMRGLEETVYPTLQSQRRIRRMLALSVLMDAQMEQVQRKCYEPHILASILIGVTSEAQREATMRGSQDADQVHGTHVQELPEMRTKVSCRESDSLPPMGDACLRKKGCSNYPLAKGAPYPTCMARTA